MSERKLKAHHGVGGEGRGRPEAALGQLVPGHLVTGPLTFEVDPDAVLVVADHPLVRIAVAGILDVYGGGRFDAHPDTPAAAQEEAQTRERGRIWMSVE